MDYSFRTAWKAWRRKRIRAKERQKTERMKFIPANLSIQNCISRRVCVCVRACSVGLIPWKLNPKRFLRCVGTNHLCWSALLRKLTHLIRTYFLTGCPSVVKWLFTSKQLTVDGEGGSEARGGLKCSHNSTWCVKAVIYDGTTAVPSWTRRREKRANCACFLIFCELVMVHC